MKRQRKMLRLCEKSAIGRYVTQAGTGGSKPGDGSVWYLPATQSVPLAM